MPNPQLAGKDFGRHEFVRESNQGETPTDPDFKKYSNNIRSFSWTPSANTAAVRGLGDADPKNFITGAEDHEIEIVYDLVQNIVDGSGNPKDAVGDALLRNSDESLYNSHSAVFRADKTAGGADDAGYRSYIVMKGGKYDSYSMSIDTGDSQPNQATLSYMAEKVRRYDISQPSADTTLEVSSTSDNDTMDITIENEGAGTTETITLTGTTAVTTTTSFSDIDAAELSAKPEGNVTISDGSGTTFLTIYGSGEFPHSEGDKGIPVLGSGSRASDISNPVVENCLDAFLEKPDGTEISARLENVDISCENNLAEQPDLGTQRKSYDAAQRSVTIDAGTMHGEGEYDDFVRDHLQNKTENIQLVTSANKFQLDNAAIMDPGSLSVETEQAFISFDASFEGAGVTITQG